MKISVITPTIRPENGLKRVSDSLKKQTFKDFEWLVEVNIGNTVDLNRAFNNMIRRARGELIVFLEDFIRIKDNGLELFFEEWKKNKDIVYTAPVAKKKEGKVEYDWRYFDDGSGVRNFMEWEIDWACASKNILCEVGGFDEYLDNGWGFDNVNIGLRMIMAGYKIKNLPENLAIALDHDSFLKHPFRKLRDCDLHNQRLNEIRRGKKINYI